MRLKPMSAFHVEQIKFNTLLLEIWLRSTCNARSAAKEAERSTWNGELWIAAILGCF